MASQARRSAIALLLAAALPPHCTALRALDPSFISTKEPERQRLDNLQDLQYYGTMMIGGQPVKGIFDTGSFELVVFSKSCDTCGIAPAYSEKQSKTYRIGNLSQVHGYGSGSCTAVDCYDTVSVVSCVADDMPMWLATDCEMPLLQQASFNAIVGIGPPGQPEYTAKAQLKQIEQMEESYTQKGQEIPLELQNMHDKVVLELAAASQKKSMLELFNVSAFSMCLGKASGTPGWLIWKDSNRGGDQGVHRIPVAGNVTWGIALKGVALHSHSSTDMVGCEKGCGAIVDTGTSLFAVPSTIYDEISEIMEGLHRSSLSMSCQDLRQFPDLVLEVEGARLAFPPSAYIGRLYGQMSKQVAKFMRNRNYVNATERCHLLLMDLGRSKETSLGPMVIIGMPFFREYYTTFDLGTGRTDRSIFVSKADEGCHPKAEGALEQTSVRSEDAWKPREVDASKLRVPDWLVDHGVETY